ncbi:MAG: mechanosensitive ion channel family protein [Lepagella sp.]
MNQLLTFILAQTPTSNENPAADVLKKEEEFFASFKGLSLDRILDKLCNTLVDFGFKLLVAIVVFYIGRFIIRKLYSFTRRVMERRGTDPSLCTFLLSLLKITLYFILVVTVIGILGLETSSFLALFASAGVAIGMALSGTLQNFAGGVLILLLKPYRVGDFIEAQGYSGTVKAIQIFNTVINTLDNKAIVIPNGGLSTGTINNYSMEDYRRVEWTVSLSYDTDYDQAKAAILSMLADDPRVVRQYIEDDRMERLQAVQVAEQEQARNEEQLLADEAAEVKKESWWRRHIRRHRRLAAKVQERIAPPVEVEKKDCTPFVGLGEMADSSINITVRAWTPSATYWPLFFEMNERFYKELPKRGFAFPFPQLDVHLNPQS